VAAAAAALTGVLATGLLAATATLLEGLLVVEAADINLVGTAGGGCDAIILHPVAVCMFAASFVVEVD